MLFMITAMVIVFFIYLSYFLVTKKLQLSHEKMSPFECGFDPVGILRKPFSVRFFFVMLMFLIFDIEIVLIMPMIPGMNFLQTFMWASIFMLFMFILLVGLGLEWIMGTMSWA